MTNNSTSTDPLAPPIGGFQEIKGRRVFVHRSGSGGPAVVFLPGASAVGMDYFLVQQQVSHFTGVACGCQECLELEVGQAQGGRFVGHDRAAHIVGW